TLAATAPLLQRWYSRTSDPNANDPYFLYATSNAGSLLGLLAYPILEPFVTRTIQTRSWAIGFWAVAALVAACAYASGHRTRPRREDVRDRAGPGIPLKRRLLWIVLALVPS